MISEIREHGGVPTLFVGRGRAVLSGINLGLPYSNRRLISDDILSRDTSNSSLSAKDIVLDIAEQAGICGNSCTAPGVKASVLTADAGVLVMLINSTSGTVSGTLPVQIDSGTVSEELGSSNPSLFGGKLCFTLDARKSAVIRISRT